MTLLDRLEAELSGWPNVSIHPHRFGGREFRVGKAEIGHVHVGGVVDIPFPRGIHDVLLAQGLAEEHRWVPNSGWITFHARLQEDFAYALWLMRLSYLRYMLKSAPDAYALLQRESRALDLSPEFESLLAQSIARRSGSQEQMPLQAAEKV